jgi:hypothetical protein
MQSSTLRKVTRRERELRNASALEPKRALDLIRSLVGLQERLGSL